MFFFSSLESRLHNFHRVNAPDTNSNKLKQLRSLFIGRNVASTESRPGIYPLTSATCILLRTRCTTAPTKTPDTVKESAF